MPFYSILFDRPSAEVPAEGTDEPGSFSDLNLDQVVAAIVAGREEYGLEPLFYSPQRDPGSVSYRQEVMRDLSSKRARGVVAAFSREMRAVRRDLAAAEQSGERLRKARLFLDAAAAYCGAVASLAGELARLELASGGLLAFRQYLVEYTSGDAFTSLMSDTQAQCEALASVQYSLRIDGSQVTVGRYAGESDYGAEIEQAFARFRRPEARDYRIGYRERPAMDYVEARIFELVVRLFPKVFSGLNEYCRRHPTILDGCLERFEREVQFYIAFLEFIEPLREAGLSFCYPVVSIGSKEEFASQAFDLALAAKLNREGAVPVCNDFFLRGPERVIVVTGPNQGGKTTFARMFGQLHYLAGLGCPVPGSEAQLFLPDRVLTHFERPEAAENQRGKLEDELLRARALLEQATGDSVIIMNEGFTSATLGDARLIGTKVLERVVGLGSLGVYVTFVDELASLGEATVSMVAQVDAGDPSRRTCRIIREPASGLAYAAAIADKYGLRYDRLKERLAP